MIQLRRGSECVNIKMHGLNHDQVLPMMNMAVVYWGLYLVYRYDTEVIVLICI